ncbi:MAG: hypothetical protein MUP64_14520 [Anaerolineae bacterium]|nr:hypothetical protein [Anaerolineae bacterium]
MEVHVRGHHVLERWLSDRRGRTLSYDGVTHYGKIVVTLRETIHLMAEIDELIPSWPMELDLETSEVWTVALKETIRLM